MAKEELKLIGIEVKIDQAKGAYAELNDKTKELKKNARDLAAEFGRNSKEAKVAGEAYRKSAKEMAVLNSQLEIGRTGFMGFAAAGTVLPGILGRISFGILRVGSAFKTLLVNPIFLAISAVTGLVVSMNNLVKQSFEFNKAMTAVKAFTGATREEYDRMKASAKALSTQTTKSATEIAESYGTLAKAGLSVNEIINATPAVINLSVGAMEDMAIATDVLVSVLRSFNMESEHSAHVADVAAEAITKSNMVLSDFAVALRYSAALAKATGVSYEELSAMIMILADRNIRGSQAGTSLRKIMLELSSQSGTLTEKFKALSDAQLSTIDSQKVFEQRAMNAGLILKDNTELIEQNTAALMNNVGQSEELREIMETSLEAAQIRSKHAWKALWLALEDGDGALAKLKKGWYNLSRYIAMYFQIQVRMRGWANQQITEGEEELLGEVKEIRTQAEIDEERAREQREADYLNFLTKWGRTKLEVLRDQMQAELDEAKADRLSGLVSEEEYQKAILVIKEKYAAQIRAASNKTRDLQLRDFDFESNILRERAAAIGKGREAELGALDSEYAAKTYKAEQYIEYLKKAEADGVKGAKEKREKAEEEFAVYKEEIEKAKGQKTLAINAKYDQMSAEAALQILRIQHDQMLDESHRSAQTIYDNQIDFLEKENKMAIGLLQSKLDANLISEEEFAAEIDKLDTQYTANRIKAAKELTDALYSENQNRLKNELETLTTGRDAEFQNLQAVHDKKMEILEAESAREIKLAGDNAELIKSIEEKTAAEREAIETELAIKKVEQYQFWANEVMGVASSIDKAIGAFARRELDQWAQVNEGKVGFEEEYEAKKIEVQRKEAIRSRALASFQTTIDTAAAIIKMLANPGGVAGVALSIAAGITGAASLAAIWAEPLPRLEGSSSSGSKGSSSKRKVSEKFHTGTYRPSTKGEEAEITRTLLTTERILSPSQTSIFDGIVSRVQAMGGSDSITRGIGDNLMEDRMTRAFSAALRKMPQPVMSWKEFENQRMRQERLYKNTIIE